MKIGGSSFQEERQFGTTGPRRMWMELADALAYLSTRVILGALFVIVVTPIGAVLRARGWDPLNRRRGHQTSYWTPYPARRRDPKHYEKMY